MYLPHQLYRLQRDVNQLNVHQHQTTAFLGGKLTKKVQESLLQLFEDLQNRLAESENAVALVNQERRNDRDQMERTVASLQNTLRTLASEVRFEKSRL